MYLRLFKYEMWVELLDNRQYWQDYDNRQRAFSVQVWRFHMIINRRPS